MIPAKDAVRKAFDYLHELYGALKDELLEEIEMTKNKQFWDVTIGFNVTETVPPSPLDEVVAAAKGYESVSTKKVMRKYKTLRVNAENGGVESMKAKQL